MLPHLNIREGVATATPAATYVLCVPAGSSSSSRPIPRRCRGCWPWREHGRELYEAAQRLDLEGIVAKRKADPYSPQTIWYKVKNPAYTQAEGRGDLFHKPR
jgi:hypothetical protein